MSSAKALAVVAVRTRVSFENRLLSRPLYQLLHGYHPNIKGYKKQLKVEKGQTFLVNRLENESGKKITFDKVFLIEDKGKTTVGTPLVDKVSVSASIIDHLKGDKVIVFKKKRRKGYKVKNGHRQYLTKIKIDNISLKKSTAKKAVIKEEKNN